MPRLSRYYLFLLIAVQLLGAIQEGRILQRNRAFRWRACTVFGICQGIAASNPILKLRGGTQRRLRPRPTADVPADNPRPRRMARTKESVREELGELFANAKTKGGTRRRRILKESPPQSSEDTERLSEALQEISDPALRKEMAIASKKTVAVKRVAHKIDPGRKLSPKPIQAPAGKKPRAHVPSPLKAVPDPSDSLDFIWRFNSDVPAGEEAAAPTAENQPMTSVIQSQAPPSSPPRKKRRENSTDRIGQLFGKPGPAREKPVAKSKLPAQTQPQSCLTAAERRRLDALLAEEGPGKFHFETLVGGAFALHRDGDLFDAEKLYQKALEKRPEDTTCNFWLAECMTEIYSRHNRDPVRLALAQNILKRNLERSSGQGHAPSAALLCEVLSVHCSDMTQAKAVMRSYPTGESDVWQEVSGYRLNFRSSK